MLNGRSVVSGLLYFLFPFLEEGLTTVDVSVTSVIHALTAEGTKIKALVDRHIQKMIATLKEKTSHEKESMLNGRSVVSGLLYFLFPFLDSFCILQLLFAIRQHLSKRLFFMTCFLLSLLNTTAIKCPI
jgi:hypothetical protein